MLRSIVFVLTSTTVLSLEIVKGEEDRDVEEEDMERTSDEELEEDVFRKRKHELISGAGKLFLLNEWLCY